MSKAVQIENPLPLGQRYTRLKNATRAVQRGLAVFTAPNRIRFLERAKENAERQTAGAVVRLSRKCALPAVGTVYPIAEDNNTTFMDGKTPAHHGRRSLAYARSANASLDDNFL